MGSWACAAAPANASAIAASKRDTEIFTTRMSVSCIGFFMITVVGKTVV
jgi:hypothetical protein